MNFKELPVHCQMPTFQYASDLHLEFYKDTEISLMNFIEPVAHTLLLAGDIGHPLKAHYSIFLREAAKLFQSIYLIAGNHEYYTRDGRPMDYVKKAIHEALPANAHFLDGEQVVQTADGIQILGTTLWSEIPSDLAKYAKGGMNDFKMIYESADLKLSPESYNALHQKEKQWLSTQLQQTRQPTIVLTHHLPSYTIIAEEYKDYALNCCFASHLDALLVPPVKAWVCGHTHTQIHSTVVPHKIPVVANPFGYPGESDAPSKKMILSLDLDV
jgi:hypothetical protein